MNNQEKISQLIKEKNTITEKYKHFFIDKSTSTYFENQYAKSIWSILIDGVLSTDRTGTGTFRLETGRRFVFNSFDIPLLRGKVVNPWNALTEVIWILTGRNDLSWLKENGVNYWDGWVKEDGTFGPIYGTQMRNFNGVDQLLNVIKKLKETPETRQAMISLWNAKDLPNMALPTCHFLYHPLIVNGKLNLHCGQRSADSFLGVPYDYMLFYFIQRILCFFTGTKPGHIIHNNHDYHLYTNHLNAVDKYFDNYLNNPKEIDINKTGVKFNLHFPEMTEELTSDSLTEWLYYFYQCNKTFTSNYEKNITHYPLIKANVSI